MNAFAYDTSEARTNIFQTKIFHFLQLSHYRRSVVFTLCFWIFLSVWRFIPSLHIVYCNKYGNGSKSRRKTMRKNCRLLLYLFIVICRWCSVLVLCASVDRSRESLLETDVDCRESINADDDDIADCAATVCRWTCLFSYYSVLWFLSSAASAKWLDGSLILMVHFGVV